MPVIILYHLTPTQRRALVIADNRLALNAGWDEEMLQLELSSLREENFDLDILGFDQDDRAKLLAAAVAEAVFMRTMVASDRVGGKWAARARMRFG